MTVRSDEVTRLLLAHRQGDSCALDSLLPLIYTDLHRLARRQLHVARPGQTLDTTSLVHEVYLKLVDQSRASWNDRAHFFAVAARAMRQIIVDYARGRCTAKRGGKQQPARLDDVNIAIGEQAEMLVEIDRALERLRDLDERMIRIVECRFFGGLTADETAQALDVSTRTVERDWKRARAWLRHELKPQSDGPDAR